MTEYDETIAREELAEVRRERDERDRIAQRDDLHAWLERRREGGA